MHKIKSVPFFIRYSLLPLLYAMLFCSAAMAQNKSASGSIYEPEAVCNDVKGQNHSAYHECFSGLESKAIKASEGRVTRQNSKLCLKPKTGSEICFTNRLGSEENDDYEIAYHYYFGTPPGLKDIAVVRSNSGEIDLDEFGEYFFISLINGNVLAHMPATAQQMAFSPDGRFLAGFNSFVIAYTSQLKVWRVDNSSNPQTWQVELNLLGLLEKVMEKHGMETTLNWSDNATLKLSTQTKPFATYMITHSCASDSNPFYDLKAKVVNQKLELSEYEDPCSSGGWIVNIQPEK